jgi:hypothetical protein
MNSFLAAILFNFRRHVSDGEILQLLDGEIPLTRERFARRHLARCWSCRARREHLIKAIVGFVDYRRQLAAPFMPPPAGARDRYLARRFEVLAENPSRLRAFGQILRSAVPPAMNPITLSSLIVAGALIALFLVWQHNAPTVSANELLDRAGVWDANPSPEHQPGVVYQKVQIRTKTGTLDRTFYRDAEGRRRPRLEPADSAEASLKEKLRAAGVDWQHPLSATAFKDWHDQLRQKSDRVKKTTSDSLTLITETQESDVKRSSFSVRTSDFHPVHREVVLRDSEEIEIAEVSYDVLRWDAVNASALFEPEAAKVVPPPPPVPNRPMVVPAPLPAMPSASQLDEAELRARLVLDDLQSTGAQIRITQLRDGVQVAGVVETDQRKKELEAQLRDVPLITVSLQSYEELAQQDSSASPISVIKAYSIDGQSSPFDRYIAQLPARPLDCDRFGEQLFSAALAIQREATELNAIDQRFTLQARAQLGSESKHLLNALVGRHMQSLSDAMLSERSLMEEFAPAGSFAGASAIVSSSKAMPPSATDARNFAGTQQAALEPASSLSELLSAAEENKNLCVALLAANDAEQRSAAEIFVDVSRTVTRLQSIFAKLSESLAVVSWPLRSDPSVSIRGDATGGSGRGVQ